MDEDRKLTILIDMDDTMENLCEAWIAWINNKYGTSVNSDDITEWDIGSAFPTIDRNDVYAPLYDNEFWETVTPKLDAVKYIKKIKDDGHTVYIATASAYETLESKMDNVLFKYFPYLAWDDVIVTSHKQLINADVLIDDGIHNLDGGKYVKILMDAPHNKSYDEAINGMVRVYNWEHAYEIIKATTSILNEKRKDSAELPVTDKPCEYNE